VVFRLAGGGGTFNLVFNLNLTKIRTNAKGKKFNSFLLLI
jgi:hypothetical protein